MCPTGDPSASSSRPASTPVPRPTGAPVVAPSILSADFAHLARDIDRVGDAEWLHIDVMDAHFVPNLSFGLPVAEAVRRSTDRFLDVHLMIEDPARWAPDYAAFDSVTFHLEAVADVAAAVDLARTLRAAGTRASVSVKPGTPVEPLLDRLAEFDMVLVMSVEPGFGGQSFMPEVLDKVRALRRRIDADGTGTLVEIDGGIGPATAGEAVAAGVDVLVAGSSVFGADDPAAQVTALREAGRAVWADRPGPAPAAGGDRDVPDAGHRGETGTDAG